MSTIAAKVLERLRQGPASCGQMAQAMGLHVQRISNGIHTLETDGRVHKVGEMKNSQGNIVPLWALTERRAVLLDECWTRAASVCHGN